MDPNFFHPGSRIQGQKDSQIPERIRIKEFKYFNLLKLFLSSRKYDQGCSSRIQIPDPDYEFLPIPDAGVKKAPGSRIRIPNTARKWLGALFN